MAPTVRSSSTATGSGVASVIVNEPAGMLDTDLLVVFQFCNDTATLADLTAPAGFVLNGSGANSGNEAVFGKVWTALPPDVGSGPWTFGSTSSAATTSVAIAAIADHNGVDVASTWHSTGGNTSFPEAPSVTPTSALGGLLLCAWCVYGGGNDVNYTVPGGMTEWSDLRTAGTAWEARATGASTGTRQASANFASVNVSTSMVIAPVDPTAPQDVTGTDSASGVESASITGSVPATDTGTATESATVEETGRDLSATDTATAIESSSVLVSVPPRVTTTPVLQRLRVDPAAVDYSSRLASSAAGSKVTSALATGQLTAAVDPQRLTVSVSDLKVSCSVSTSRSGGTVAYH